MGVAEPVRDEASVEERREQERIELVDVPDQVTVDVRERRVQLPDADRQPLVEELVRHDVPVGDLGRENGQNPAEGEPERGDRDPGPVQPVHASNLRKERPPGVWLSRGGVALA
jgi:hypothetical protein